MRSSILIAIVAFAALWAVFPSCGDSETTTEQVIAIFSGEGLPPTLSETGLFADLAKFEHSSEAMTYTVRYPLWSDNAEKDRSIYLPEGGKIEIDDDGRFLFPDGTWFTKTFSLPVGDSLKRLETRVMRKEDDRWTYVTYRWNDEQTEASLTKGRDITIDHKLPGHDLDYVIPGTIACKKCHAGSSVSGFQPFQLDDDVLAKLAQDGHLDVEPSEILNRSVQGRFPEETAALGYLAANCAHCHNPDASAYVGDELDLRHHRIIDETVDVAAIRLQHEDTKTLVVPGKPQDSVAYRLFIRELDERTIAELKMPPVGNQLVDPKGRKIIEKWIHLVKKETGEPR